MTKISIFVMLIISCSVQEKRVEFRNNSDDTGFYESDTNGIEFTSIADSKKTFKLKFLPTISKAHFKSLEIASDCNPKMFCIDFQLTEEGSKLYSELTKRNIRKNIYHVIDGKVIEEILVMDEITGGLGRFSIQEQYFDSLFIEK